MKIETLALDTEIRFRSAAERAEILAGEGVRRAGYLVTESLYREHPDWILSSGDRVPLLLLGAGMAGLLALAVCIYPLLAKKKKPEPP